MAGNWDLFQAVLAKSSLSKENTTVKRPMESVSKQETPPFISGSNLSRLLRYLRIHERWVFPEGKIMRHLADYILGFAICFMLFLFFRQQKEIKMLRIAQSFSIFTSNGTDQDRVNEWLKAAETNKELTLAIYRP
jgi:hypothetical protein